MLPKSSNHDQHLFYNVSRKEKNVILNNYFEVNIERWYSCPSPLFLRSSLLWYDIYLYMDACGLLRLYDLCGTHSFLDSYELYRILDLLEFAGFLGILLSHHIISALHKRIHLISVWHLLLYSQDRSLFLMFARRTSFTCLMFQNLSIYLSIWGKARLFIALHYLRIRTLLSNFLWPNMDLYILYSTSQTSSHLSYSV